MRCFTVNYNELNGILSPLFFISQPQDTENFTPLSKIALVNPNRQKPKLGIDEPVPYVGLPETDDGEIKEVLYRPYKEVKGRGIFIKDDVLFARIEPSVFNKKYIYADDLRNNDYAFTSTEFYVVKAKEDIDPKFIFYMFFTAPVFEQIKGKTTGSTGRRRLDKGSFEKLLIPFPSKETRAKAVEILDQAHKQRREKLKQADELLSSIDGYVRQQLGIDYTEPEEEKIYTVNAQNLEDNRQDPYYHNPKFATTIKQLKAGKYPIETLGKHISEIRYGASVKNDYVDEGIPLLRILNLKPNHIDLTNVVHLPKTKSKAIGNCYVYKDDLLVSRSGTIGIVAVVPKEADGFAYGSFMIKFRLNDGLDNNYASVWLNSDISKLLVQRERIGAIQGNITIPTIQGFLLPIPPLDKQKEIASGVMEKYGKVESLKDEASKLLEAAKKQVEEMILN